jgi:hypothetical protein
VLLVVVELCGGMEMVLFLQLLWHQSPRSYGVLEISLRMGHKLFRSLFPQAPLAQPNKLLMKSWPHWLV